MKGRGWGMSAGTGYLQEGAGLGPPSEATHEYVRSFVANRGKENMVLTAQKYARAV